VLSNADMKRLELRQAFDIANSAPNLQIRNTLGDALTFIRLDHL
jgi:hypothetical protein